MYDFGLVQVPKLALSSLHWKVAVVSVSLNEKLALVRNVGFAGNVVSVGAGGTAVAASTAIGRRSAVRYERVELLRTVDLEALKTLVAVPPRTLAGFGFFSPPRFVGAC